MGAGGVQAAHGTKAAKFDQLLKKGGVNSGELKGGVKLPSVFQSSAE